MTRRALATLVAAVTTLTSALAIGRLVEPELWMGRTLLCAGLVTATLVLLRRRTVSPTLPSLAGLAVGALAVQAVYFPDQTVLRVLPTRATIDAVSAAVPTALLDIRLAAPPIGDSDAVALLVTAGVVLVLLLAEMLAVGAYAPVWAGVPLVGLWSVPITLGAAVDVGVFVAAAAAFVLLIGVQAREHPPRGRGGGGAARGIAVVAAVALVVSVAAAPAVLRLPAPVRLHTVYDLVDSGSTRLDLGLDLRDDLVREEDVPLLTYIGAAPDEVGPLQAYTLTTFDGSSWSREPAGEAWPVEEELLWPGSLEEVELGPERTIDIAVEELAQDRLLIPGEPRVVDPPGPAEYLPTSDEIQTDATGSVGYRVTFSPRVLDADRLAALDPTGQADQVAPELLAVPDTGYQGEIAALTETVVAEADAQTPYEQALAIQNWLRDPAEFVYTTTIEPPQTTDAVWDFLGDRQGYCVQFATAMVMMARAQGIPARVAVGFLPGERAEGVSTVTSYDAHAWPQLLFPEVGWVRFEPTPSVQTGAAPQYAPAPDAVEEPTATPGPTEAPSSATEETTAADEETSAAAGAGETGTTGTGPGTWWLVLALLALAGAAAAAIARRAAARSIDVATLWLRTREHLVAAGLQASPSMTPRAVQRAAAGLLDPEGERALGDLADAVQEVAYGRSGAPRLSMAELTDRAETVRTSAREAASARRRPTYV